MKGFRSTAITALALLGLFTIFVAVSFAVLLRMDPEMGRRLRDQFVTEAERAILEQAAARGPEPAALRMASGVAVDHEAILRSIGEEKHSEEVRSLVERLKMRERSLDERDTWLRSQQAELRMQELDRERQARHLEQQRQRVLDLIADLERQRAAWADDQAVVLSRFQSIDEVERARLTDLAERLQAQAEPWWREMDPGRIARLLLLMDARRSARFLDRIALDGERPLLPTEIHRAMLGIDLEGVGAAQAEALARVYSAMAPERALGYLNSSSDRDFARILLAMDPKRSAAVVDELRRTDEVRARAVQAAMEQGGGA